MNNDMWKKTSKQDSGGFYSAPAPKQAPINDHISPALAVANEVVDKIEFSSKPKSDDSSLEGILAKATENYSVQEEDKSMNPSGGSFSAPISAPVSAPVSAPMSAPVSAPMSAPVAIPVAAPVSASTADSSISRITRDTIIHGSLISETDVEVLGTIMGDIESKLVVNLTGKVYGNISAKNVLLDGAAVSGNIYVAEDLRLLGGSILVGDIYAQSTEIDGKIKGNISVSDRVKIKNGAYIIGDITSKNISVEPGAVVQGRISIESVATEQDIERKFEELQRLALPVLQGAKPVTPPPARTSFAPMAEPAPEITFAPVSVPVEEPVAAPVAPVAVQEPAETALAEMAVDTVLAKDPAPDVAETATSSDSSLESLLANAFSPSNDEGLDSTSTMAAADSDAISEDEEAAKQAKLRSALADLKKRSK